MPAITEGAARILVPDWAGGTGPEKGPGSSSMPVFYNPAMRLGRDLCVLAAGRIGLSRPLRAVDGLAGSGVRAIRLALETGGIDFYSVDPFAVRRFKQDRRFELLPAGLDVLESILADPDVKHVLQDDRTLIELLGHEMRRAA